MLKKSMKQEGVNTPLLFTNGFDINDIEQNLAHSFVDVLSLGADGQPVIPTAGTYKIYVKTMQQGGFKAVQGGDLDAKLTGGDALPDGLQEGVSFAANALEIKIVPSGVQGVTSYRVQICQNLT